MIAAFCLAVAASSSAPLTAPIGPAEAIVLAEKHPERGTPGRFEMKVVTAERRPHALYLNSTADYRAPDNVTFQLTASAAKTLEKRLGGRPEAVLIGKMVTVQGEVRAVPIANTVGGVPRSLNRYQHSVLVREAAKLTVQYSP